MTPLSTPLARGLSVAAGALLLAFAAGAPADAAPGRAAQLRADRPGAERSLRSAEALAGGRGVRDGRELSPALASLSARSGALSATDRENANALLARPTDPGQTGQPGGPYTVPDVAAYTAHFCFHWVQTTADAPSLADGNGNGFPDYVEDLADTFETVYASEHGDLDWRLPKSDGAVGGCADDGNEGLTDVYVKDIGKLGLYGYASPDSGQPSGDSTRYAFLVMDDDYSAAEFPGYDGPLEPMQVTAAHEYNHVLQYAYDILQDKWMFESTATWMEEKVYPDVDDYHQYIAPWTQRSTMPITLADSTKMYGSAIFDRWLDDIYGEDIVRKLWERSAVLDSFAPATYDEAIRQGHGPGFSYELLDFAASSAEWQTSDSGVHEGATFPEMKRIPVKLPTDGTVVSGKLDHTGYALFDVALSDAPKLKLTGGLPAGVAGGIALVGRNGDSVWKVVGAQPGGGQTSITLDNPGRFSRITAVVMNGDYAKAGWNGQDWNWSHDQQPISLAVTEVRGTPDPGTGGGGQQTGGGQGQQTGGGTIGGGGTITPAAPLVRLTPGTLPKLGKASALTVAASSSVAGTFTARATIDAKTAKKLGLGRKAATIGTGKATLAAAGTAKLKIKLTPKAKARLGRARSAVSVVVKVTFKPSDGGGSTRTLKLRLKP